MNGARLVIMEILNSQLISKSMEKGAQNANAIRRVPVTISTVMLEPDSVPVYPEWSV